MKGNGKNTKRQQKANYSLPFAHLVTHRIVMPIRPENRWLYPIDWQQLSHTVRFDRAGAKCEGCGRPHLRRVVHLGNGRWWDADVRCWRSDRGKRLSMKGGFVLASIRVTYVVLACAHLDHDPRNSAPSNLKALCQRCHMIHDAAEHRWQRRWNVFRLRAIRDLYEDPRVTRERIASR
jgi:ribosomal protein S14